jgi:NADPH:quinone reductase-like Zn-dependent oxidoreductase
MLAVTIRAHGGPEQIHLADLPRPSAPGPRDVVVALRAAALNHLDLFVLGGMPGLALLGEGVLHPVLDTGLPVRGARAAFELMAAGRQFGKVILDIAA